MVSYSLDTPLLYVTYFDKVNKISNHLKFILKLIITPPPPFFTKFQPQQNPPQLDYLQKITKNNFYSIQISIFPLLGHFCVCLVSPFAFLFYR